MTLLDLQGMAPETSAKPPPGSRASKGCNNDGRSFLSLLCSLF
ncbi:SapB/AmfS family lantipeptide [Streptomyces sp. ISL-98]|nr:SapB/AmfS family lanthipeptide [Streptomyces sp. ISL-98]MBT2507367.1 SapB/AmfS family lantipeptide [Streptomyces sp. ISL-98]